MRASDLVKIDLDGNIIEEAHQAGMSPRKINAAGFCIHSALLHGPDCDWDCTSAALISCGVWQRAWLRGSCD